MKYLKLFEQFSLSSQGFLLNENNTFAPHGWDSLPEAQVQLSAQEIYDNITQELKVVKNIVKKVRITSRLTVEQIQKKLEEPEMWESEAYVTIEYPGIYGEETSPDVYAEWEPTKQVLVWYFPYRNGLQMFYVTSTIHRHNVTGSYSGFDTTVILTSELPKFIEEYIYRVFVEELQSQGYMDEYGVSIFGKQLYAKLSKIDDISNLDYSLADLLRTNKKVSKYIKMLINGSEWEELFDE